MCPGWRSAFEDPCTRPTRGRACSCAIARLLAKHALGPETPVHAPSHLHPASSSEEGPSLASGAPRGSGSALHHSQDRRGARGHHSGRKRARRRSHFSGRAATAARGRAQSFSRASRRHCSSPRVLILSSNTHCASAGAAYGPCQRSARGLYRVVQAHRGQHPAPCCAECVPDPGRMYTPYGIWGSSAAPTSLV